MIGFLYGQTEYNMLRCSLRLNEYIAKAKEFGYEALTITDHNMYGHFKFYSKCKEFGIKPLIGLELYTYGCNNMKQPIIGYALNNTGYKELLTISSLDKCEGKIFTLDELSLYENIIFICTQNSDIYKVSSENDLQTLTKYLKDYNDKLKHFGVGICLKEDILVDCCNNLKNICKDLRIKYYPLSQTLYLQKEDNIVYKCLRVIDNESGDDGYNSHFKNVEEITNEFFMFEECFDYFDELVKLIDIEIKPVDISLPKYPKTNGKSSCEYLKSLCIKGLERRLAYEKNANYNSYNQRLDYELTVINKMGYDDYFLIVWDFVRFAKKEGIMVGPGRGSAAGSLVAYCLGITNVDPLKYDLLFERFLNPERVSMPDIDMDFPDDKRNMVMQYVEELYGKERVCNISIFGTFQIKSSIRDIGKALQIPQNEIDVISKIASTTNNYQALLEQYKNNYRIYELLVIAKKVENLPRHSSTHAAGIILSHTELINNVPLQKGVNVTNQSQLEASDLATLGLLKMDFLGIRDLATIDNVCKEIKGMDNISIQKIPLNDKNTFQLLCRGDTLGVFQLESEGMKNTLRKLKPSTFDDLVAILALYRPGPMDFIDEYIERKNGKKYTYIHPNLEPILKSTYGIIVYQEQIMRIGYEFAGLSLGQADILRRAVSKKDKGALDSNRYTFVNEAMKKGYSESISNQIYDLIVKFANYGFNKSHSVAYALVTYQMAYFKANYFSLFIAKFLNNMIGNSKTLVSYLDYAKNHNVVIERPDINISTTGFVVKNGHLVFPLQGITNIGNALAKEILIEREKGLFKSFDDFKNRIPTMNQKALEMLIYSGAFDSFGKSKKSMIENSNSLIEIFNRSINADEVLIQKETEYELDELKKYELDALGINISYDLFRNISVLLKNNSAYQFGRSMLDKSFRTIIQFKYIKEINTKNGQRMIIGDIYDGKSVITGIIFPRVYEAYKNIIEYDKLFVSYGRLGFNNEKNKYEFIIEELREL